MFCQASTHEVEQVAVVGGVIRKHRQANTLTKQWLESRIIALPDFLALNTGQVLQLHPKIGGNDVERQKRRTHVDSVVFGHLPPVKSRAVNAFFADNLGTAAKLCVIHRQYASFAGNNIPGFVKRKRTQAA